MKIIDCLPFGDRPHIITVRGEQVDVYRNQIIVWISIDDVSRPLPAILDTGHGHKLSIGEGQLRRWFGASLSRMGELEVGHRRVVQEAAELHLHRNVPTRQALRGDSYVLEMPQSSSVFEERKSLAHFRPRNAGAANARTRGRRRVSLDQLGYRSGPATIEPTSGSVE